MNIQLMSENCFGCGICGETCSFGAIEMIENPEGFLYPKINEAKCRKCEKCYNVCPINRLHETKKRIKVYAGIHKNRGVWQRSSSGGAFSAICELYGNEDTYYVGAVYDSETKMIRHEVKRGVSNISDFRGSKYVQSSLLGIYDTILELVKNGHKVLFSGTPCQTSAIQSRLPKELLENVLLVSVICNGVGSPKVFRDYVRYVEEKYNSKIKKYEFRDKRLSLGVHKLYRRTVFFYNGRKKSENDDLLNNCYLQKLICRKSCFDCIYDMNNLVGDITIGDLKNQYSIIEKLPYNKNASIIIGHSEKGIALCNNLPKKMLLYSLTIDDVSYPKNDCRFLDKRNAFFDDYCSGTTGIESLLKKYKKRDSLIMFVWRKIPDKIRGMIKRTLRKG